MFYTKRNQNNIKKIEKLELEHLYETLKICFIIIIIIKIFSILQKYEDNSMFDHIISEEAKKIKEMGAKVLALSSLLTMTVE